MSLTKVILIVIVSCCALLSISACASTASEGNAVKDHVEKRLLLTNPLNRHKQFQHRLHAGRRQKFSIGLLNTPST